MDNNLDLTPEQLQEMGIRPHGEPPVATTTATDSEQQETKTTPLGDQSSSASSKGLREILGLDGYEDKDDEFIKTDITTRIQRERELSEKVAALENEKHSFVNPFDSEDEKKFFYFKKQNPNLDYATVDKLLTTDLSKLDPIEAIILKKIVEDPSKKDKVSLLRKQIEKDYNIKPLTDEQKESMSQSEIEDYNENIELSRMSLEDRAKEAVKDLSKITGDIKIPEIKPKEVAEKENAESFSKFTDGWKNITTEVLKGIENISIQIQGEKELEKYLDFPMSTQDKAELVAEAAEIMAHAGLGFEKENIPVLRSIAQERFLLKKFPQIITKVVEETRSKTIEEWEKKTNNVGKPEAKVPTGGQKTKYEESMQRIQEKEGIAPNW